MDFDFLFNIIKLGFGFTALAFFVGIVCFLGLTFYLDVWVRASMRKELHR